MSQIVSSPQQIRDSPLNTSTSKHLYSFSKNPRFHNDIRINCSSAFYDLPSCMEKRKTGFGYGTKLDFTKHNTVTPAPNAYQLKSTFDSEKSKSMGITFGYGREELWQNGIIPRQKVGPGPCNYKLPEQLSKISYTIGTRTPINNKLTYLSSPGPGTYKSPTTLSTSGQYFLSKYPGSKATLINPPRSQRFTNFQANKNNPGPCHYMPKTHLQVGGQYVISKYHSSLGKSFPKGSRGQVQLPSYESSILICLNSKKIFFCLGLKAPGPGSYRLPSDFGYYEAKVDKSNNQFIAREKSQDEGEKEAN